MNDIDAHALISLFVDDIWGWYLDENEKLPDGQGKIL